MSTEARHTPVPPRPTAVPPRPASPPRPAQPPATGRPGPEEPDDPVADRARTRPDTTGEATGAARGVWSPWRGTQEFEARDGFDGYDDFDAFGRSSLSGGSRAATGTPTGSDDADAEADAGAAAGAEVPPARRGGTGAEATAPAPASVSTPPSASVSTPPRFPGLRARPAGEDAPKSPAPPSASARFPDTAPSAGREAPSQAEDSVVPPRPARSPAPSPPAGGTAVPPRPSRDPAASPRVEDAVVPPPSRRPVPSPRGTDGRAGVAREAPAAGVPGRADDVRPAPDPSLSWSAPVPGVGGTVVSFAVPEGYDAQGRPRPLAGHLRTRAVAVAACVVLGLGLIGGALTGSWLVGDPGDSGARDTFAAAGGLWHSISVDRLFPPVVAGRGAGPGGADRSWTRIAVAPDGGCAQAFDPLLRKALAPVGCRRLLRATYTDATQSHVTTVGLLFTKADAAGMASLATRFRNEGLDRRTDLMPRPYAAPDTAAARFGVRQRASWTVSVLTDAPVVVYAVSGWADGRTVDNPLPAGEAMQSGSTAAVAQSGLGHEARGLADRIERALRKDVRGSATEAPS
ncbi:hypothetical protein ABT301_28000 [Streptomyces sp. NPDC000987]|uniref:hypothetical protein n=1 Tax=Streptomyces sp. NPDC000987 TaxID=3154374 RepID=UPI00332BC73D